VTTFRFLVLSNPAEGQEDEFNAWYDKEHLDDLLAIDGFTAAQRYRVGPGPGLETAPFRYAAVYEVEAGDVSDAHARLTEALGSGRVRRSGAIALGALTLWLEAIGDRRTSTRADVKGAAHP
jgi:hypothetical protein